MKQGKAIFVKEELVTFVAKERVSDDFLIQTVFFILPLLSLMQLRSDLALVFLHLGLMYFMTFLCPADHDVAVSGRPAQLTAIRYIFVFLSTFFCPWDDKIALKDMNIQCPSHYHCHNSAYGEIVWRNLSMGWTWVSLSYSFC